MTNTQQNKLILSKNTIKLYGPVLGQGSSSNLPYALHKNKIYATFKDTSGGDKLFGLTQSNLYNNMTMEQNSQKLILHKKNESYNDPFEFITEKFDDTYNYLFDVSVADICYQLLYNVKNLNNDIITQRDIVLYNYYKTSYNNFSENTDLSFYITNNSPAALTGKFRLYDTSLDLTNLNNISGEDISLSTSEIIYKRNVRENIDLSFIYKVKYANNIDNTFIDEGTVNILYLSLAQNYMLKSFNQAITTREFKSTTFLLHIADIFLGYQDLSYNYTQQTQYGFLSMNNNIITYIPYEDFLGIDTFSYYVSYQDPHGNSELDISSEMATVTIQVLNPVQPNIVYKSVRTSLKYIYKKSNPLKGFCCKVEKVNTISLKKLEYVYYGNDILMGSQDNSGITILGWLTPTQLPSGDQLASIFTSIDIDPLENYTMQNQIGVQLDSSGALYFTAYDNSSQLIMYGKSDISKADTPAFQIGIRQHFSIVIKNPDKYPENEPILSIYIKGNLSAAYTYNQMQNFMTYSIDVINVMLGVINITDVAFPNYVERKFNTFGMGYIGKIEDLYIYHKIIHSVGRKTIRNKKPCDCPPDIHYLSLDWNSLLKAPIKIADNDENISLKGMIVNYLDPTIPTQHISITDGTVNSADVNSIVASESHFNIMTGTDVNTIEAWAFYGCTSLQSIEMPLVNTIEAWAFYECTSLLSIKMPLVNTIGGGAFYICTSLLSIKMPLVNTIEAWTFYGCTSLLSIEMPLVNTIETWAFNECTSLQSIEMPLVNTIGERAFNECTSLQSIEMPLVNTIEAWAFYGCTSLLSIEMPLVNTIEAWAFNECTSLLSIKMPLVNTIGERAFNGCTSLHNIRINQACDIIGNVFDNTPYSGTLTLIGSNENYYDASNSVGISNLVGNTISGDTILRSNVIIYDLSGWMLQYEKI
jgi:hypothetical protein